MGRFQPNADEAAVDSLGSFFTLRREDPSGHAMMISSHSDEIGGVVRAVELAGFSRAHKLGGVLDALLQGRKVLVKGPLGAVSFKSGNARTEEERRQVVLAEKAYLFEIRSGPALS